PIYFTHLQSPVDCRHFQAPIPSSNFSSTLPLPLELQQSQPSHCHFVTLSLFSFS
ncbi:unnamed protein product, partial [Citrullus colocynthis]